jgi:Protein of unknown function (DUF1573)
MKKYFIFFTTAAILISCDIRRSDRLIDDAGKEKAVAAKEMEAAMKDSTTVQAIDTAYNFGKIAEGDKVEYKFRFKNTGNKPLVIANATASCGCTVPEKPEKPVLPGETSFIKVIFNSKGKSGHQEKTIYVNSNVKPSFPELKLTGEVEKAKE